MLGGDKQEVKVVEQLDWNSEPPRGEVEQMGRTAKAQAAA